MITRTIRDERVAIIEVEVIGLNRRAKIEATLDTGFTGYLTLPEFLIHYLRLPQNHAIAITSPVAAERYPAQIISTECAANSAFISLSTPFSTQSTNALNSR